MTAVAAGDNKTHLPISFNPSCPSGYSSPRGGAKAPSGEQSHTSDLPASKGNGTSTGQGCGQAAGGVE